MLARALQRWVFKRRWLTFAVLGLAFLAFGAGTLNLGLMLKANLDLIAQYGWQALGDGAAQQLFEIVVTGYLSMAAYVVFKACEHALVHALTHAVKEDSVP